MSENVNKSIAPLAFEGGQVFGPFFKARWQNYQNIVSRADFFSNMPSEWIAYQNAYVKQWEQWASGFVLGLHNNNFFSTGMGKTVCDILVRECMRGDYRFDSVDADASTKITDWAEKNRLREVIINCFDFANRCGNAIIKLNVNPTTLELYPTAHPVVRTYFQVNRRGDVVKARFYDMLADGTTSDEKYYVMEDRIMNNGKAYYRLRMSCFSGQVTNPQFKEAQIQDLEKVSVGAKATFKNLYGDIKLNTWYRLPFDTLGCYNWKNTSTSAAISEMEGYGDSSLHTALDILYAIDYNYTQAQFDLYYGRTMVLLPPEMQQKQHVVYQGVDYGEASLDAKLPPLSGTVFVQTPTSAGGVISDKPAQPMFVQSDLRGVAHEQINDFYLKLLASKVGLSSSSLANHLTYNNSKTATEIDRETDTTDVTVDKKRQLANIAINEMLEDVCKFYSIAADVNITWNRTGTGNKDAIMEEYRAGIMPLSQCIARLHPELTKEEVAEWTKELENKQSTNNINEIFGLGDEH